MKVIINLLHVLLVFILLSSRASPLQTTYSTYSIMPGGRRNPLSMTTVLQTIEGVVQTATSKSESGLLSKLGQKEVQLDSTTVFVDLEIQVMC